MVRGVLGFVAFVLWTLLVLSCCVQPLYILTSVTLSSDDGPRKGPVLNEVYEVSRG